MNDDARAMSGIECDPALNGGGMRDMFFREPPLWEEVIKTLAELETRINNLVASLPSTI